MRPTGNGRARGLVSSRTSGSRVEARTFTPAPDLADVVECYWIGRWDLRGQPPHVTELLGDPCVHIVFERGTSRIVGVWTKLWRRTLEGRGLVRAAKLRAGAAPLVVPGPAWHTTDRITALGQAIACDVDVLERRILGPTDDLAALERLQRWLRSIRSADDGDAAIATELVHRIATDADITSVDALATISGFGARALQRLFRAQVGISPKAAIRRFRLQETAVRLERGDRLRLAHLAAELGYADQAHLARDFKRATGRTPAHFAKTVGR